MEKEISEFKNTAVVTLKDKPKSREEELLSSLGISNSCFTFLPPEYSTSYDLFVNGIQMEGSYLNPSDEIILDSKTFRRITEEDIINFLNNKQGYGNI